jgi:DNA-binding MarR family transcriptional regulator
MNKEMDKEIARISLNKFLKMYFNSCKEIYEEINFGRITSKQFKYLKEIHSKGEVTQTQLAKTFNISKPTMNEFINRFLDSGIVIKKKCFDDKRMIYISLTEMGKTLASSNILESERAVEKMIDKLSIDEMNAIKLIFDRFGDEN